MRKNEPDITSVEQDPDRSFKIGASETIPVTVHIPENVAENVKRQKINKIYDILHPAH